MFIIAEQVATPARGVTRRSRCGCHVDNRSIRQSPASPRVDSPYIHQTMVHETSSGNQRGGVSLIEIAVSMVLILVLLSVLLPALQRARVISYREQCATNLRTIGVAVSSYLEDHGGAFPFVPIQPAWHYGGLRYSEATGASFLDPTRPFNHWFARTRSGVDMTHLFCCPADRGIEGDAGHLGTAGRQVCRLFGTSYRANENLFDARRPGLTESLRGVRRTEITAGPSRLLVLGDPIWHETLEQTGNNANWHAEPSTGNILFLDGSVRFQAIRPMGGPIVTDPMPPGTVFPPVELTTDFPTDR